MNTTRRERRAIEVRSRIINAGTELLNEKPLNEFSVDDICHAADVAKKTYYNYFDNKEALYADVIQDGMTEQVGDIFNRAEERFTRFSDRVHFVMDKQIELRKGYVEMDRNFFRAGIMEIGRNPRRVKEMYGFFDAYFERWLRDGQETGEITRDYDAVFMSRFCTAGMFDINQYWINDPSYPHLQRYKELAIFLTDMTAEY